LKKHFRTASVYEYMFWDSAYRLEKFPFNVEKNKGV
ncbi:thiaminase II, partial [Sulfolobus sp. B1]